MSENQSVVDAITYSIIGFFAAWKIGKTIQNVVIGFQEAKLALALFSLQSEGTTIAQGLLNGTLKASEGLVALFTGKVKLSEIASAGFAKAQAAVNAIMAANPIALVTVAIAALISIIVLCIKHWDDIKSAASKCWDGIKSVWSSVSNWFNSKVVQPISNIFNGLGNSLMNAFKAPINFIIDGINTFLRGINKIKLPSWVPGIGGKGFNFTPIQRLAQGKYVEANSPQLAIVGDNTREGEVITPESKIYEQQMRAIKDSGLLNGASGGIAEVHLYVHYEDGKVIIQKINKTQIEAGEILLLT